MSILQPQRIKSTREGHEFLQSISRQSIGLRFSEADSRLTPLSSRVLGPGYWETGQDWPTFGGEGMNLLLQINWSEVAAATTPQERADTLLALPESGLTQIYLASHDHRAGSDPQDSERQAGWRVVHWHDPDLSRHVRHPDAPGVIHPLFPAADGAAISFFPLQQPGNLTDAIEGLCETECSEGVFDDMLRTMNDSSVSRIGGFPFFWQEDPRKARINHGSEFRLFLQMGSDSPFDFGEDGQAHWFIRPSDLQTMDFNRLAYSCERN